MDRQALSNAAAKITGQWVDKTGDLDKNLKEAKANLETAITNKQKLGVDTTSEENLLGHINDQLGSKNGTDGQSGELTNAIPETQNAVQGTKDEPIPSAQPVATGGPTDKTAITEPWASESEAKAASPTNTGSQSPSNPTPSDPTAITEPWASESEAKAASPTNTGSQSPSNPPPSDPTTIAEPWASESEAKAASPTNAASQTASSPSPSESAASAKSSPINGTTWQQVNDGVPNHYQLSDGSSVKDYTVASQQNGNTITYTYTPGMMRAALRAKP